MHLQTSKILRVAEIKRFFTMALDNTQLILKRLRTKYTTALTHARQDVKPTYNNNVQFALTGYSYHPLDDFDTDIVYNALGELQAIFTDRIGAIFFDLAHYITEKKAAEDLKQTIKFLEDRKDQILEIKTKYASIKPEIYPVNVVYNYYKEILEILQHEILDSDEFKQFENPGLIDSLKEQNLELGFQLYWRKRKWIYISHFIAFLLFMTAGALAILYKEDQSLPKYLVVYIPVFLGFFTIMFSLLFGFHNTFKDSYKMLLPFTVSALRTTYLINGLYF